MQRRRIAGSFKIFSNMNFIDKSLNKPSYLPGEAAQTRNFAAICGEAEKRITYL